MKTRKIKLISSFVALTMVSAVLGVSTVYRIEKVTVEASLVSEEAKAESEHLQKELEELYQRDSIFFAGTDKAKSLLQSYPYFRITGFEKSYPKRLVIELTENAEVYAIEKTAGAEYYILNADGVVLEIRGEHVNQLNKEENVLLKGLNVTAKKGE